MARRSSEALFMNLKVPPNESETGRVALIRLDCFEDLVAAARDNLNKAQKRLATERMKYAADRPFTEVERLALVEHVKTGGALCCNGGLVWLRTKLPEPWAQAINGWAYENSSCSPCTDVEREERTERIRNMTLEEILRRMGEEP
jgi:hypothetical protein